MGVMDTVEARPGFLSSMRLLWAVVIVAVVGAALFAAFRFLYNPLAELPKDFRALFTGNALAEQYEFTGSALDEFRGLARADGTVLHESVSLPDGGAVAIVSIPGKAQYMVGVIGIDDTFTPLHTDSRQIAGLSVTNGIALFSVLPAPASATYAVAKAEAPENDVVEEGSAEGPVEFDTPSEEPSAAESGTRVMLADIDTGETWDLGLGMSAHFHPDGSTIVAVSTAGVIQMNPVMGERRLLLAYPTEGGAISPDGRIAALRTSESAFNVYDISARPTPVGIIHSDEVISDITFIDDVHMLARTMDGTSVYTLSPKGVGKLVARIPFVTQ